MSQQKWLKKRRKEYDVMEQTNKMMSWMMPIMSVSISLVAPLGTSIILACK